METRERSRSPGVAADAVTIGLAVTFAAVIFVARELLPNPDEGVTNLYALPIAIVAVRFGAIGGVVAALASMALFALWEMTSPDVQIGPIGYLIRATAFVLLGWLVGRFARERHALIARLTEMAHSDPLTGLANRAMLETAFIAELTRTRRHGHRGALLLADLDGFKAINDTFGHAVGDQVLKEVATLLRGQLRAVDTVARIGGDEFVVLLPETTRSGADMVIRKLDEAIPRTLRTVDGEAVKVGVSIGCICFDGSTTESPEGLLHAADHAMYQVKAGRPTR